MFVACDESGILSSDRYLVIGSAWISKDDLCEFEKMITKLRLERKCWGEIEWLKTTPISIPMLQFYKDFIGYAFRKVPISFRFIVVEKALLDMPRYHQNSQELIRFKFMHLLLSRHGQHFLPAKDRTGLHIVFDKFTQSKRARDEQWAYKMRGHIERYLGSPIEHMQPCTSHICSLVQLCDLFTGAISTSWNVPPSKISDSKKELIELIERSTGKILRARTLPTERDFNIWIWQPSPLRGLVMR